MIGWPKIHVLRHETKKKTKTNPKNTIGKLAGQKKKPKGGVFLVKPKAKKICQKQNSTLKPAIPHHTGSKTTAIIMSHSTAKEDKEHTGNTFIAQKVFSRMMTEAFPLLCWLRFSGTGEMPSPFQQQPSLDTLSKKHHFFHCPASSLKTTKTKTTIHLGPLLLESCPIQGRESR